MWRTRGFCVQGYSHLKEGTPCQDAYQHGTVEAPDGQTLEVLAVADGAGSRPRSAEGAVLAVSLTVQILSQLAYDEGLPSCGAACQELLRAAYQDIREEFGRAADILAGRDRIGDFAATLIAAVLADDRVALLQVGDGFAAVRTGESPAWPAQYHLLPPVQTEAEYANETAFITSAAGSDPQVLCVSDSGITGVLLSTDGLARPALTWRQRERWGVNASFLGAIFDHLDKPDHDPRLVVRTLLSDDVVKRTGDDLTLLVAVRT